MPDQPLQPFAPPTSLAWLPGGAPTASVVVEWFFYFAFTFWLIYTTIAIYHWVKYSHAAKISFPAIAAHLVVSFLLISFAFSGVLFI